jgi:hypothetical protein
MGRKKKLITLISILIALILIGIGSKFANSSMIKSKDAQLVKNQTGYLSEAEHGTANEAKGNIETSEKVDSEIGLKSGDKLTEIPQAMNPGDPNKMLSSNMTLAEAKVVLENYKKMLKNKKPDEITGYLKDAAKDLGTTLEEVASINNVEVQPKVEKVAEVKVEEPEVKVVEKAKTPVTTPKVTQPVADDSEEVSELTKQFREATVSGPSTYDGKDPGAGKLH